MAACVVKVIFIFYINILVCFGFWRVCQAELTLQIEANRVSRVVYAMFKVASLTQTRAREERERTHRGSCVATPTQLTKTTTTTNERAALTTSYSPASCVRLSWPSPWIATRILYKCILLLLLFRCVCVYLCVSSNCTPRRIDYNWGYSHSSTMYNASCFALSGETSFR